MICKFLINPFPTHAYSTFNKENSFTLVLFFFLKFSSSIYYWIAKKNDEKFENLNPFHIFSSSKFCNKILNF